MNIAKAIDFFIGKHRFDNLVELRRARLFVRACLLTSLFSNSYIWSSILFEFERGVHLMIFNVVGFLLLPLLARTRLPMVWLGNLYITIGAAAVLILTYYSGGLWSAIFPWIISIPVLAILVVDKFSGIVWGIVSLLAMAYFGTLALQGFEFPVEYNQEMKTAWFVVILPGLLLIVMFISLVFEHMQSKALNEVEEKNVQLGLQKETIVAQAKELEELVEEKNYIIRILAHDLRSPLRNINGLIELLKSDKPAESDNEYINMINDASLNAQDLVNKVLEMDEVDHKQDNIKLDPVVVAPILKNVVDSMEENARIKSIQINWTNIAANNTVRADATYLKLIFENLISNAIKFSNNNTAVNVEMSNVDSLLQIKVIDQGPGIDPEEEDKLFQKFSRLSPRPTAGESSTGLGLSLVKRYVELIEGRVWYDGDSGQGACFVVELPLAQ